MAENGTHKLILGLLSGLTLEKAKPFFLSLEKTGYAGDICLFVSDLDPATVAFLRARQINLVPLQKAFLNPRWARLAGLGKPFLTRRRWALLERHLALTYVHLHCARHFYCHSYLAECGGQYDHVMLADIRDVLFQKDPFAFDRPDGLSVFMEDPGRTIGTCPTNSNWIQHGFGKAVLKELHDQPIFCSGTIFGPPAVMLDYFDRVLRLYYARKTNHTIDQATHNYVLHKQPPEKVYRFSNDSGPVLTMANMDPRQIQFNDQGFLINQAGRVVNVVHQYDRHPEIARRLLKLLT